MHITATHIGTATLLLEIDGVRLLTDPVFDAPGRRYEFGWGTASTHVEAPALGLEALGPIDAVLLSHDQHADNFDDAGRALLPKVPVVVTTPAAAKRLGHAGAVGLKPGEKTSVKGLTITGTPARHGPIGSLPVVGAVTGFLLEGAGMPGPIYISGDTVWFGALETLAKTVKPSIAFLHLGGVAFKTTGPVKYTLDAQAGVTAAKAFGAKTVVPVHFEGWTHFRQPRAEAERVLGEALGSSVRWLERGVATRLQL